jgi:hypothetical protein
MLPDLTGFLSWPLAWVLEQIRPALSMAYSVWN